MKFKLFRAKSVLLFMLLFQFTFACKDTPVYIPLAGKPIYTDDYVKNNLGKVQFLIPEVLELTQVAQSLTDYKDKTRTGKYWTDVQNYFGNYRNHPLIIKLNSQVLNYNDDYDLRAGAWATEFDKNGNFIEGFYPYQGNKNIFGSLKADFLDFARKSNFRQFYQMQQSYYNELQNTQAELMPVRQMWTWLEERFPARSQSYKIIFSPLFGGNHNTNWYGNSVFRESLMFVSYTGDCCSTVTLKVKEGLSTRVVFTEIDHNYVNPVTDEYKTQVNQVFQNRAMWTAGKDSDNYSTPELVFNEYMTWAVFSLYCLDTFDSSDFTTINQITENQMVNSRGFVKFRDFNRYLLGLYQKDRTMKSKEIFTKMLDWSKTQ